MKSALQVKSKATPMLRPIDIARKLRISTSALRHYESWGIVPPIERGPNGYRIYTDIHVCYFECIRATSEGFGMPVTSDVMKKLQVGEVKEALWLVSECQASLYQEKMMAEKSLDQWKDRNADGHDENIDARVSIHQSLHQLHKTNQEQLRGIHYLYRLCYKLKLWKSN